MANGLDFAMLVCASAGAVAFSVFLAYGILRVGFALMRPQRRAAVKTQPEAARVS
jgi:hypothetical protein